MYTFGPLIAKNSRSGRLLGGAPVTVTTLDGVTLTTVPAPLVTNHEGYLPAFTVDTDQRVILARPRGGDPLPLYAHEAIGDAAEAADTINTGRLSEDALKSTFVALTEYEQKAREAVADTQAVADAVAGLVVERDLLTQDAAAGTYATKSDFSSPLSRFVWRLDNTPAVKIVGVGDSITEGTTVTADGGTPGVDDYLSLVTAELDAAHPATVTKSNRAVSGRTAHTSYTLGDFASAIADAGDLYVISFGHNDLRSDTSTPGTGYPRASMVRAMEKMIRRIRDEVPGADIIILLQNPYTPASYGANTYLELQSSLLRPLAAFYGCAIVDAYTPFIALGDYSALMADTGHPNAAGHRLIADTVKAAIPATGRPVTPAVPAKDLYGAARLARTWDTTTQITNLTATPAKGVRYLHGGAGWSSVTTAPHTSSTVGDFMRILAFGDEVVLRLDTGPGHGTVTIDIDAEATAHTIDLAAYSTGQRYFPLVGLGPGGHVIVVKVASGSVTFRGAEAWARQAYSLDLDADVDITGGTWASSQQIATSPSGVRLTSTTLGDSLTFDIMGTGMVLAHNKYPSNQQLEVQVDGGAWASVEVSEPTSSGGLFGTANVVSGLPFGKHTISLRSAGARSSFIVYDVTVLDESTTGYVRDVQIATALRSTV